MKASKLRRKEVSGRSCEIEGTQEALAKMLGCKTEEVKQILIDKLEGYKQVLHYAGIVHDKDIDPMTKELVKIHIHIIVEFAADTVYKTASSFIGIQTQCFEKIHQKRLYGQKWVSDVGGGLAYLTHRNAPSKYQYDDSEVFATDGWDWKKRRDDSERFKKTYEIGWILEKIQSGEITEANITKFVELETYVKYSKQINLAFDYCRKRQSLNHNRSLTVIYLQGEKGSGKTTLAKEFCDNKNLSYLITGGTNDIFEGYAGQEGIIIDDARPETLSPEEWLKILDNNTNSLARSRYHNKQIEAKYILLTSTINLTNFFDGFFKEDPRQLYRRIKLWLVVQKDYIEIYEYRSNEGKYALVKKSKNWIKEKYGNPDLTDAKKSEIINGFGLIDDYSEKEQVPLEEKEAVIDIDFNNEIVTLEGQPKKVADFPKTIFEVMYKCMEVKK